MSKLNTLSNFNHHKSDIQSVDWLIRKGSFSPGMYSCREEMYITSSDETVTNTTDVGLTIKTFAPLYGYNEEGFPDYSKYVGQYSSIDTLICWNRRSIHLSTKFIRWSQLWWYVVCRSSDWLWYMCVRWSMRCLGRQRWCFWRTGYLWRSYRHDALAMLGKLYSCCGWMCSRCGAELKSTMRRT
jgi:hypothetical protein